MFRWGRVRGRGWRRGRGVRPRSAEVLEYYDDGSEPQVVSVDLPDIIEGASEQEVRRQIDALLGPVYRYPRRRVEDLTACLYRPGYMPQPPVSSLYYDPLAPPREKGKKD